jgi:hypothetical protein
MFRQKLMITRGLSTWLWTLVLASIQSVHFRFQVRSRLCYVTLHHPGGTADAPLHGSDLASDSVFFNKD